MAVADYESPEIKVYEGQFLEVLDQSNPHMWLVKTKPTKVCKCIKTVSKKVSDTGRCLEYMHCLAVVSDING